MPCKSCISGSNRGKRGRRITPPPKPKVKEGFKAGMGKSKSQAHVKKAIVGERA